MNEVSFKPCDQFEVTVLRGRNITKGWLNDAIDIPDPYVKLQLDGVPWPIRNTEVRDGDVNPEWNEKFTFIIPRALKNMELKIKLMEANFFRALDQEIGSTTFDLKSIPYAEDVKKNFEFGESTVEMEIQRSRRKSPNLRIDPSLHEDEMEYLNARRKHTLEALKSFLNKDDLTAEQAPRIAVIGSGGGYRAMVGFAGALKALQECGLLDCATYLGSLSGSTWYVSSLYSRGGPKRTSLKDVTKYAKQGLESSLWSPLLEPTTLVDFVSRINEKQNKLQPISLVDLYGLLLGHKLLGENFHTFKFSDCLDVVKDGSVPLPIMTGIHVKARTSEKEFADWMEFTPHEIGIRKYTSFVQCPLFGSKYFKGCVIKEMEEAPLHYLMGIWGSAFAISFESWFGKDDQDEGRTMSRGAEIGQQNEDSRVRTMRNEPVGNSEATNREALRHNLDSIISASSDNTRVHSSEVPRRSVLLPDTSLAVSEIEVTAMRGIVSLTPPSGVLKAILTFIEKKTPILAQEYRASRIHNFFRGLEAGDSNSLGELDHLTNELARTIMVVDAGLSFNVPFPPFVRPERKIDVIIAYDFSLRPKDNVTPLGELILAEEWAKSNGLPFPRIDRGVFTKLGMQECYVFEDEEDSEAPVVVFLPICNAKFRDYKFPGIPRKTKAEKEFGNFTIFEDYGTPYDTFKLSYSELAFDRLHDLMEFNTLLCLEKIKQVVSSRVKSA